MPFYMDALTHILAGFGLSGAAGLNAWLPLLIVGLADRYTNLLNLQGPYAVLAQPLVLGILGVLLLVEVVADKVPAVDSINDAIHTLIRPAAGAILFAANANAFGHMDSGLAMVFGLLAAGSIHAVKATTRPLVTAGTAGTGNFVVSTLEDVLAATVAILALLAPALAIALLALCVFGAWRGGRAVKGRVLGFRAKPGRA